MRYDCRASWAFACYSIWTSHHTANGTCTGPWKSKKIIAPVGANLL
jgi:hypothetical protein